VAGFPVRLPIRRQEMVAGRVHAGRKGKFQTDGKGQENGDPRGTRGSPSYIYTFRRPRRSLCLRTTNRRDQSS
jgi:hypothetical protein